MKLFHKDQPGYIFNPRQEQGQNDYSDGSRQCL